MSDCNHEWRTFNGGQFAQCSRCGINPSDELTRLQSEVERLRGRCGELEESLTELIQHYSETWDLPILQRAEAARDGRGNAWLLRKQAEAVEFVLDKLVEDQPCVSANVTGVINYYAQRLRRQAAESEK